MTDRFIWTLEQRGHAARGGLDTEADLIAILHAQDLPGVMPADWIFAMLDFDSAEGTAVHDSSLGWCLTIKRLSGGL